MKYMGKITDPKDLVTKEYTDTKYTKPSTGIPKDHLSQSVISSLDKADSALQEHQSLSAYRTSAAQDAIDNNQDAVIAGKASIDVWRLG